MPNTGNSETSIDHLWPSLADSQGQVIRNQLFSCGSSGGPGSLTPKIESYVCVPYRGGVNTRLSSKHGNPGGSFPSPSKIFPGHPRSHFIAQISSSTLARKIPWTEGPGGLQSMGSLGVDFTFTFHFHALEKEMATHSSVLAWRIPGTGEHGGLPSMGLHRVRHD